MIPELEESRTRLHQLPNVVATGLGFKTVNGGLTGHPSIIVSVGKKVPLEELKPQDVVPRTIQGIPTDVVEVGRIKAFSANSERARPAPGGVSVAHRSVTAGTFGCVVQRGKNRYILSNNHVLANSNDCRIGDAILQPGPFDGGVSSRDTIATLEGYVPILMWGTESSSTCPVATRFAGIANTVAKLVGSKARLYAHSEREIKIPENLVDAAIALPLQDDSISTEIKDVGKPTGVGKAALDMPIKKSGRTTGFTTGRVLQTQVTVDVDFGNGRMARFKDQLMAGPMSQGGDSGSAMLDNSNRVVGLLFAGSNQVTIFSRFEHVEDALNVSLVVE